MNVHQDTPSSQFPADAQAAAPAPMAPVRPFYWSVRREVWENRSIYIAPLAVTALVLFGTFLGTIGQVHRTQPAADPASRHAAVVAAYSMGPAAIMFTTIIVAIFYSLDALYGERRDRSVLFWKSLPVSDLTTVLSKATIPIVVLPAVAWILSVTAFGIMAFLGTAVRLARGINPETLWTELHFVQQPMVMLYGLAVHALWFAPAYAWFLLISAWAKRAPFLWAVLPLLAVSAVEKIAFNTQYFLYMLRYRLVGPMREAFNVAPHRRGEFTVLDQLVQLDPVRFLTTPGLWVGLAFAAAFLVAAVRLRRYREPI